MEKMSKKLTDSRRSATTLLALSVLCLFFPLTGLPKSFARYLLGQAGSVTTSVARPILTINIDDPENDTVDPENSLDVTFTVTNFDTTESQNNEVELEYYLAFSNFNPTSGSPKIPVTYRLFDQSCNGTELSLDSNNKMVSPKTASVFSTTGESHEFCLKLTWDQNGSKDYSLADIANTLNIVADVKQKINTGDS